MPAQYEILFYKYTHKITGKFLITMFSTVSTCLKTSSVKETEPNYQKF